MNKSNPEAAEEAWKQLKFADQLNGSLGNGNTLGNFVEVHDLCFPPTYRKQVYLYYLQREQAGNCGDFTNYDILVNAYSHEVEEKNGKITARTPSFTDRVIYRPPFGCADATYCDYYNCIHTVTTSDHVPVLASLIFRSGNNPQIPELGKRVYFILFYSQNQIHQFHILLKI